MAQRKPYFLTHTAYSDERNQHAAFSRNIPCNENKYEKCSVDFRRFLQYYYIVSLCLCIDMHIVYCTYIYLHLHVPIETCQTFSKCCCHRLFSLSFSHSFFSVLRFPHHNFLQISSFRCTVYLFTSKYFEKHFNYIQISIEKKKTPNRARCKEPAEKFVTVEKAINHFTSIKYSVRKLLSKLMIFLVQLDGTTF